MWHWSDLEMKGIVLGYLFSHREAVDLTAHLMPRRAGH